MATLSTRSLAQIVQSWTAAAQAACSQILDFSVGSVNLALAQAAGAVGLWLQNLALSVMALTRFNTSTGSDADSWGAQFEFDRLPEVAATGQVTFTEATGSDMVLVPVGTALQTLDGSQSFTVTADASQPTYVAALNGYQFPHLTTTLTASVQAVTPGTGGNVLAGTITVIGSPVAGVSAVTNAAGFTNGANAESDNAYHARFPNYLAGLASADNAAIIRAIGGVQQNLDVLLVENQDYPSLTTDNGNFFAVINDGSGAPPATLLTAITTAVDAVRGFTIRWQGAKAPAPVTVSVTMVLTTDPGYTHGVVVQQVIAALTAYLNAWKLKNKTVPLTRMGQIAYDASPGVTDVTGTLINGVAADLTLTTLQTATAGTMNVT